MTLNVKTLLLWILSCLILFAGIWLLIDVSINLAAIVFSLPTIIYITLALMQRNTSKRGLVLYTIVLYFVALLIWGLFVHHPLAGWVVQNLFLMVFYVSISSAYFEKRILSIGSFPGLNAGIICGILFGTNSTDPAGAKLSNDWLLAFIVIGVSVIMGTLIQIAVDHGLFCKNKVLSQYSKER